LTVTDEILEIYARRGASAYFGEGVSTAEHCLQAAYFAQTAAAPPPLIVAALLHDVGHLVVDLPDDIADWIEDARHEDVGCGWLAERFPAEVYEPVRLHVPAKRYLCATDPRYFSRLSAASVATLKLQGGPMSTAEIARFEQERYCREAVTIRRFDDQGKVVGLLTPALETYRPLLESIAIGARKSGSLPGTD
jgi:[1-hydroxy-2-(trimethylamino)ethyl]phosphonate dioxygenase